MIGGVEELMEWYLHIQGSKGERSSAICECRVATFTVPEYSSMIENTYYKNHGNAGTGRLERSLTPPIASPPARWDPEDTDRPKSQVRDYLVYNTAGGAITNTEADLSVS